MEYFIIENNGQQAGPFSLEQLVQKAITPETLVWAQGMKDWTPAWKIAELKTVLETIEAIKANTANKENAEGTSADASPPLSAHLPEPEEASLMRIPMFGFTLSFLATFSMISSSLSFSTTIKMRLPIF